jgi:hypothetical protein
MMRTSARRGGLGLVTSIVAVACASADPSTEQALDESSGLPACGDDPASQPDRCVDPWGAIRCKVHSGFPGDELALCEPESDDGMLIHFGPADYSDPEAVEPFLLAPGGEEEFCLYVNTPNQEMRYFRAYNGRLRPNSHHFIVTMPEEHHATDASPWKCGPQILDRWLFGSQDLQIDVGHEANELEPSDPDYGLAHDIPPDQTLLLDFHNVNTTSEVMLREAWAVLRFMPPDEVRVHSDLIAFYQLRIDLPPLARATTERLHCEVPTNESGTKEPVYLGLVTGHAHERLTRFSVWHDRLDGASDLIYETLDWEEPGNATFRDGVFNPPLPVSGSWGAISGYRKVVPGETISFECDYQNNLDRPVRFGETSQDEMCVVFGHYFPSAGGMWNCFPQ